MSVLNCSSSYRWAIHRACERANPPPDGLTEAEAAEWRREHAWSPNQLRHSHATRIRKSHGLGGAQVALGHSKCDVTQVYTERDQQLAARIALEVG